MKKTAARNATRRPPEELRAEYRLDYSRAKPNRFAGRVDQTRLMVGLDPDVAKVFTTPQAVNDILRALILTMPKWSRGKFGT